jgi:hypothetical protein
VAERAELLISSSDDELVELERREWCKKVDAELQDMRSAREHSMALAMLLDNLPADDPAVRERVTRLTGLAHLGDDARARLRGWLSGTPQQSSDEAELDVGPVFPHRAPWFASTATAGSPTSASWFSAQAQPSGFVRCSHEPQPSRAQR